MYLTVNSDDRYYYKADGLYFC